MKSFLFISVIATFCGILLIPNSELRTVYAEIIDRVAAFVDDEPITLSELGERYEETKKVKPDIGRGQVLNTMVNRLLIKREAKKLKIKGRNEDEIINQYIDLKLRSYIRIKNEDIEQFYGENRKEFSEKTLAEVKDAIEKYLVEKEVNKRLKRLLHELKKKAYVKIQFKNE